MRIQGGRRAPSSCCGAESREFPTGARPGSIPSTESIRLEKRSELIEPNPMLQEGRTRGGENQAQQPRTYESLCPDTSALQRPRSDTVNLPSIRRAMQAVGYHLKDQGLNLLINNAGISSHGTLCSLDSQEMLDVFATNVVGPLQVVKEFLPLLEQAAKGAGKEGLSCSRAAVINISSKLGSIGLCLRVPEAPMYPYRASKDQVPFPTSTDFVAMKCLLSCPPTPWVVLAGLCLFQAAQNMVTRCLAAELQAKGILCVAIHPGWVKTDMGTEEAPLTVEHSVRGILTVLANLSQDTSGAFLDWEGNSLPW
ncbi:C-factor-like isoform X1 [Motacilla alba alba]|uniref:C-factor-like isoform X1 n=1 Tax=Motacilla alba alba TaxID=1094192 RepID=UPI0018D56683|nr:C-factor-like isoform X1 [Motacilla alba alba]